MLDAAPRTELAELQREAANRRDFAVVGGMLGVALSHSRCVGDQSVASTPDAARELAEAIALLRGAVTELGDDPVAAYLGEAILRWECAPLSKAAHGLAVIVRQLHPTLREQHGLLDTPPLTNWKVHDVDDHAALHAAGLGRRKRGVRIAVFAAIVVAFAAWLLSQLFGTQSQADGMQRLCDIPINCSPCMYELHRGDPRRYRVYLRQHVTSPELMPLLASMTASPTAAPETLRAAAASLGIDRCTLADDLARPTVISPQRTSGR